RRAAAIDRLDPREIHLHEGLRVEPARAHRALELGDGDLLEVDAFTRPDGGAGREKRRDAESGGQQSAGSQELPPRRARCGVNLTHGQSPRTRDVRSKVTIIAR